KAQRLKKQEELSKKLAEKTGRPATELSKMVELCEVIESSVEDVDALAEGRHERRREIMHNQALEAGVVFQEQLDRLISAAAKRRSDALQQLEHYRAGLGRQLRELTDHIIEGEAVELNTPISIGKYVGSDTAEAKDIAESRRSNGPSVD